MSMILPTDDVITAAVDSNLPNVDCHIAQIEAAVTALAEDLARHLKITTHGANWEGKDFAGLCASFYPVTPDQPCPDVIRAGDESGDWEPAKEVWVDPNLKPPVIHRSPPAGREEMPCCNLSPHEVPQHDRMTTDPKLVTCPKYKSRK